MRAFAETDALIGRVPRAPLSLPSLFHTLRQLAGLVVVELERESWLDAYLLTAGISQLIADQLQPDPLSLRRISEVLAREGGEIGGTVAARLTRPLANGLDRLIAIGPTAHSLRRLSAVVGAGLRDLADLVADPDTTPPAHTSLGALRRRCEALASSSTRLSRALRTDVVRLPASFRSFDQHPDDVGRLARDFTIAQPDRRRPLLVVGIRTSGSYLGPLLAAHLRAQGYREVDVCTLRPARAPQAQERAMIRRLAANEGLALICDDPPVTGGSIVRAASELERLGLAGSSIVLALALFGSVEELPTALRSYRSVLLPFGDWSIQGRLAADAVRNAVGELIGPGRRVVDATRLRLCLPRTGRGHLKAVFRITVADVGTGEEAIEELSVEGVGVGYYGNHAVAVVEGMREFFPEVLGVRDGLLFRRWMPDVASAEQLASVEREAVAARLAQYASTRNRLLPLEQDITLRQGGQYPAWEAASTVLSRSFRRGSLAGRALVTDPAVKHLLRVRRPSVIDGRLKLSRWFIQHGPDDMVKVDWDQGSSWNHGLTCCDPIFDLAGVTAASQDDALAGDLRRAYDALVDDPIDEERWLLYQLAHLADPRPEGRDARRRASARAVRNYFGRVYFDDLVAGDEGSHGPLCAIDIDGVLETEHLGFPALTPASASGLRALLAHGYRPVVVTGRSLADVIERCASYRLAGGVAEYGSAIYERRSARVTVLTDPAEQSAVARLRAELRTRDEVILDEDYTHAIRAFVRDARGARGPLRPQTVADAQRIAGAERIASVEGEGQTDLIPDSIDKGRGARALACALDDRDGAGAHAVFAFAVGDSQSDVPMLALARRPFVPAHARRVLGGQFAVTRAAYQGGFAEAVGRLIGHRPGACARCRVRELSPERRLLLGVLGVRERGMRRLPWQLIKVSARPWG